MSESVTLKLTLREANLIAMVLKESRETRAKLLESPHYPDSLREGETKHGVRQEAEQNIFTSDDILRKLGV